jgi:exosome complex RNA-binding protein Csl4
LMYTTNVYQDSTVLSARDGQPQKNRTAEYCSQIGATFSPHLKPSTATKMTTRTTSAPTLRFAVGSTVVPGDRLVGSVGRNCEVLPGRGAYARNGRIYASVVGTLSLDSSLQDSPEEINKGGGDAARPGAADGISVDTHGNPPSAPHRFRVSVRSAKEIASERVLRVEDVVLGRVLRITNQQAVVEVLAKHRSHGSLLPFPCEGYIRKEDVWTASTDDVPIQDSFLPGDVVLARVLSLGDPRRYLLTTAAPELGVIHAVSATGFPMVPTSWKEMRCSESGILEPRKVAKPRDLSGSEKVLKLQC